MEAMEMIIQGRTVKSAIKIAREIFKVKESQLQVEVLDKGKRGFFGLFGRPATIRVTVQQGQRKMSRAASSEVDREGTAEVKEGTLRIYPPSGKGQAAVVIPTPGIILRVNGVVVHSSRPIGATEEVEVECLKEVSPAGVEVTVSSDGFHARVKVMPQITIRYELMDQTAQNVLQLLTRRHEERAKIITVSEVEAALRSKGVIYGLDYGEMLMAVEAADGVPRVVARGDPVREGRDGFVEYLFNREPVQITYREEEKINYWERFVFPTVKEGEELALVHPSIPGVAGRKVTGELVKPRPVKEASLRVKDGVIISDCGQKAIAAIAGRPVLAGYLNPYLKIVRLMVHPGDVDLKSGNLAFWGDLLILGNITEGMRVSAHGDITVMGNAAGAEIQAGGSVVCRGSFIKCRVRAGGLKSFYNCLAPLLHDLGKILVGIIQEITRIQQHPAYHDKLKSGDINRIAKLLIERKKNELSVVVGKYGAALEQADLPLPRPIRELAQSIKYMTKGPFIWEEAIPDKLEEMLKKKEDIDYILDTLQDQPGDILCSYAQNSLLDASGNIIITDEGCFNSTLTAGKQVRVNGVFRGGEVYALENVFIDEAGSPGLLAGKVMIKVAEEAAVRIRKVYMETSIQVGNRSCYFDEECERIIVYLGSNGALKIKAYGD
ncbi:MAG: FapA family protein [Bacillota bacterium]